MLHHHQAAMPSIGQYRLLLAAFFLSSFNNVADDPLANPIIYLHTSAIVKPNIYHAPRWYNDDVNYKHKRKFKKTKTIKDQRDELC